MAHNLEIQQIRKFATLPVWTKQAPVVTFMIRRLGVRCLKNENNIVHILRNGHQRVQNWTFMTQNVSVKPIVVAAAVITVAWSNSGSDKI